MKAEVYADVTSHGKDCPPLGVVIAHLVPGARPASPAEPSKLWNLKARSSAFTRFKICWKSDRALNVWQVISLPELGDRKSVTHCGTLMAARQQALFSNCAQFLRAAASWRSL
jgi:hypothetical protein